MNLSARFVYLMEFMAIFGAVTTFSASLSLYIYLCIYCTVFEPFSIYIANLLEFIPNN